eukprot:Skav230212  [mRNA]  locus=scaffold1765:92103:94469:- [translate_table: standard]
MNAQDHLPTHRARWIAVLQRLEDHDQGISWEGWGPPSKSNPLIWDAWLPSTDDELRMLTPAKEDMSMYMNPEYLPKSAPYFAKENMIRFRLPSMQHKTQTIMALYGSQHKLPEGLIRSKGLHGFFSAEKGIPRFWKPTELALIHLQVDALTLLRPIQLAWKSMGNSIVVHHAIAGIVNSFHLLHPKPEGFVLATFLQQVVDSRIKATQCTEIFDEFGWSIARTREEAQHNHEAISRMANIMGWHDTEHPEWLPYTFYDPQEGLCDVFTLKPRKIHSTGTQITATLAFEAQPIQSDDVDEEAQVDEQDMPLAAHDEPDAFFQRPGGNDVPPTEEVESTDSEPCMDQHHLEEPQPQQNLDQDWQDVSLFLIPGTYGQMKVADTMTFGQLLKLWQNKLFPAMFLNQHANTDMIVDMPVTHTLLCPIALAKEALGIQQDEVVCEIDFPPRENRVVFLADTPGDTYCIGPTATKWSEITMQYPELPEVGYTEWGETADDRKLQHSCRIGLQPLQVHAFHDFAEFLRCEPHVRLMHHTPPSTDILVVHFAGPTHDIHLLANLWHRALGHDWQSQHGRQMCMQVDDDNHLRMIFRPTGKRVATPIMMLQHAIAARIMQTLSICTHSQDSVHRLVIKDFTAKVCSFTIENTPNMQAIFTCLRHAYANFANGETPRLICRGKVIQPEADMHELFQIANQPDELIAHIVMPLAGGTGGAKSDHRKSVHSILASMLLEHGIPLADVPNSVQTLHSSFGLHKLTHALFLSHDDEKLAQFREMCRLSHIPIHDVSTDRKQV